MSDLFIIYSENFCKIFSQLNSSINDIEKSCKSVDDNLIKKIEHDFKEAEKILKNLLLKKQKRFRNTNLILINLKLPFLKTRNHFLILIP